MMGGKGVGVGVGRRLDPQDPGSKDEEWREAAGGNSHADITKNAARTEEGFLSRGSIAGTDFKKQDTFMVSWPSLCLASSLEGVLQP